MKYAFYKYPIKGSHKDPQLIPRGGKESRGILDKDKKQKYAEGQNRFLNKKITEVVDKLDKEVDMQPMDIDE